MSSLHEESSVRPILSLGRYALFGELATGGMATVHFGRMSSLGGFNRTVAIKRMRRDIARDPEFVAMFLDEARLTSRIEHPNDIRMEGGWEPPVDMERWIHLLVDARPHDRWRPHRVQFAGSWHEVDVIGTVVGLAEGERGFRVRTRTGAEMTLVRERLGHWYADVRY